MDHFLEQEQGQGVYNSTGTFTVDAGRAREKRARYALAGTGEWALKVVQSAVSAGAPEITVRTSKSEVEFQFGTGQRIVSATQGTTTIFSFANLWKASEVESILRSPDLGEEIWAQELALALCSIPETKGVEVRLSLAGAGHDYLRKGSKWLQVRQKHYDDRTGLEITGISQQEVAACQLELGRRATGMPVKFVLDGRRLSNLRYSSLAMPDVHQALVGGGALPQLGFGTFVVSPDTFEPPLKSIRAELCTHQDFGWDRQPWEQSGSGCWLVSVDVSQEARKKPSTLSWYRHGVEVRRETIILEGGRVKLCILLSADQLTADFSGLKLREDKAFEEARDGVLACLREGVEIPELVRISARTKDPSDDLSEILVGWFRRLTGRSGKDWDAIEGEIQKDLTRLDFSRVRRGETVL